MKIFKIIYSILVAFIVLITLLLIVSVFPIAGNYKIMVVQSGSMAPAIKMGSIVVVKPADEYKIGDVITFGPYSKTKAPTTHRIFDIKIVNGEPVYITKGDANNTPDTREITKRDVLGRVLLSVPYLGFAVDFVKKPIGFALIIIVPAAIIIFDEMKKIYGEIRKKKEKAIHDS
ncbi:MAG: Signal peptidase I W [candidate division WS2 bacterium]|nr:Signal peptidase I W [Candidatus Lithacetigena glycinireducens]